MLDPLSDLIALLRPSTIFSKGISGAGAWAVRYSDFGHPGFCTVLEGSCQLAVDGQEAVTLEAGDFILLPATPGFTMSGFAPAEPIALDPHATAGVADEVRHGRQDGDPDVRMMGGYFAFASPEAGLLVSQLPAMIHLRGAERLSALVAMLREETAAERPGRDLLLARLVEILLVQRFGGAGYGFRRLARIIAILRSELVVDGRGGVGNQLGEAVEGFTSDVFGAGGAAAGSILGLAGEILGLFAPAARRGFGSIHDGDVAVLLIRALLAGHGQFLSLAF